MTNDRGWLVEKSGPAVLLTVYAQPKASRTRIAGLHGDTLKICVAAPPVDGKANEALLKFLSKLFRIPKSSVTIQSGEQSRTKRFLLEGLSHDAAKKIIDQKL